MNNLKTFYEMLEVCQFNVSQDSKHKFVKLQWNGLAS